MVLAIRFIYPTTANVFCSEINDTPFSQMSKPSKANNQMTRKPMQLMPGLFALWPLVFIRQCRINLVSELFLSTYQYVQLTQEWATSNFTTALTVYVCLMTSLHCICTECLDCLIQ